MIVIGDVHGCYKSLMALIEQLPKDEKICFVGDLMDRGPRSRQVIEYVMANHDCIKGNHEDMMVAACTFIGGHLKVDYNHSGFCHNGGLKTLDSYKVYEDEELASGEICQIHKINEKLIKSHIEWMDKLPVYREYKD